MTKEIDTLLTVYLHPKTLQCNFSRNNMECMAKLASAGLITTFTGKDFGNVWLITAKGISTVQSYYSQENNDG